VAGAALSLAGSGGRRRPWFRRRAQPQGVGGRQQGNGSGGGGGADPAAGRRLWADDSQTVLSPLLMGRLGSPQGRTCSTTGGRWPNELGPTEFAQTHAHTSFGQDQLVLPRQAQHVFAAVMQDDQLASALEQLFAGHGPARRGAIAASAFFGLRHRPVSLLQLHDRDSFHSGTYTIEPSLSR